MSYIQSDTITTVALAESAGLVELVEEELNLVAGGAHQSSGSNYNKHKLSMKGSTFAGPNGAGSTFSMQEEDISSSAFETQED